MRTTVRIRSLAAVAGVIALALLPATTALAATVSVSIGDNFYSPATVTVSVGDTVRWTNNGQAPHSVTADNGSFDSSPGCPQDIAACLGNGDTYSRTFAATGSFSYYCTVHGQTMSGTVVVQGGGTTTSPPSPSPTDDDGLADTGPTDALIPFMVGGGLLLLAGLGVLFVVRRRAVGR